MVSESKLISNKIPVLTVTVVFIIILACFNIFIQDDAFISFRYAKNLVDYNNFTWNADDVVKIEGYTNFLWTAMLALAMKAGVGPVLASKMLGICFGAGTILVTYKISGFIFADFRYRLLSILLLGTNYTFSAYMTGGLETQLQTFCIVCVCLMVFKSMDAERAPWIHLLLAGIFTGLAILTRIDSALLCGLFILYLLYIHVKKPTYKFYQVVLEAICIGLPILFLVLPWFAWKYYYYGDILPNSFYLKGTSFSFLVVKASLGYIFSFFSSYQLFPIIIILLYHYKKVIDQRYLLPFIIIIGFWLAYIFKVGGDFMEYRFFVPVIPFIILLCVWCISLMDSRWAKFLLIFVMVAGSVSHRILFTEFRGIQAIKTLNDDVILGKPNWAAVGIRLNEVFKKQGADVTIATSAAGAIPFYADLKTIDMLGVNDRWIAVNGETIAEDYFRPGHNKWAKLDYYLQVKANLIVGHPQVREKTWSQGKKALAVDQLQNFLIAYLKIEDLPTNTKILEIPLDDNHNFYVLYLLKDSGIDRVIREQNLKMFDIIN